MKTERGNNRVAKRDPRADEPVELAVKFLHETDQAILVTEDDTTKVWLPKSQVDSQEWERGKVHTITIPRWLYEAKGFAGGSDT